jgi:hypothetical protein
MVERTDSDKLSREPVMVKLGNTEYPIHPKPIIESRKWKKLAKKEIDKIDPVFNVQMEDYQKSLPLLKELIFENLDNLVDLVFEWEKELPKKEIMNTATEEEMIDALIIILRMAFPFAKLMSQING